MSRIKFLHCADLHLDSPFHGLRSLPSTIFKKLQSSTFDALHKVIQVAIDQNVDFVLIAGDLFDGENRSIYAQAKLREQFLRLKEYNIPAYIIYGNHDHLEGNFSQFRFPDNIHVFSSAVEVKPFLKDNKHLANIYGFSYPSRHHFINETDHYKKTGNNVPFHIGMLHGNLSGRNEHDPYAPFTIPQLLSKEFNYWALGHIHKREILNEEPYIVYPGNTQGRHSKEIGDKGCYVVTLHDNQRTDLQFHSTSSILWDTLEMDISNIKTMEELLDYIREEKEDRRTKGKWFLRLIFEGRGDLHGQLYQRETIEDILQLMNEGEEANETFVYIFDVKSRTEPFVNKEQLEQIPFFQDFFTIVENTTECDVTPLYKHVDARRYLTALTEEELLEIKKEAENWILTQLVGE